MSIVTVTINLRWLFAFWMRWVHHAIEHCLACLLACLLACIIIIIIIKQPHYHLPHCDHLTLLCLCRACYTEHASFTVVQRVLLEAVVGCPCRNHEDRRVRMAFISGGACQQTSTMDRDLHKSKSYAMCLHNSVLLLLLVVAVFVVLIVIVIVTCLCRC